MPARHRNRVDRLRAKLVGNLLEIGFVVTPQVTWFFDRI
jgi:hypothetical protein